MMKTSFQSLFAATIFLKILGATLGFQPQVLHVQHPQSYHAVATTTTTTSLSMGGFWDQLKESFLDTRDGDFVKLDEYADAYGPGPLLVLYNVPAGVTNEEIKDMVADGAPQAFAKGISLYRVDELNDERDAALDQAPMSIVLQGMADGSFRDSYQTTPAMAMTMTSINPIVVTFFSGFSNAELLEVYNILGSEIYQEAQISPACAKAVPNAMAKSLRQVLEEIGGDHKDAMAMAEKGEN